MLGCQLRVIVWFSAESAARVCPRSPRDIAWSMSLLEIAPGNFSEISAYCVGEEPVQFLL